MVNQIRSQCANDIRKRDLEIRRLKEHLIGQQRGKREGLGSSTIVIKPMPTNLDSSGSTVDGRGGEDLDSPNYSLRQETTEFLTQLSQGLSDENDNLISLVRSTLVTLRNLQGLSVGSKASSRSQFQTESRQTEPGMDEAPEGDVLLALPASYDTLSAEMDDVLEHLRTLLTNPSFVPIEEVEIRDEEIGRLREGWEKMEGRWRQAVAMMDGWKKRMVNDGDTISLEDLKQGLGLGAAIDGVAGAQHDPVAADEEEDFSQDDDALGEDSEDERAGDSDGDFQANTSRDSLKRTYKTMNDGAEEQEAEESTSGITSHQDAITLAEASGNARPALSPRKVSFNAIPEEITSDVAENIEDENDDDLEELALINSSTTKEPSPSQAFDRSRSRIPRQVGFSVPIHIQW